jgi:hypothetical protein
MSRIDQVLRELSDMRSFYLKLQASQRTPLVGESEAAEMPESLFCRGAACYYALGCHARSC